jgi:NAD+ synthase
MMRDVELVVEWIKDYVHNAGFKRVVLGLSGGIDSAVVAALAAKALGPKNVIGISMPCDSNPESIKRAEKFVEKFKIKYEHVPLENIFRAYDHTLDVKTEEDKDTLDAKTLEEKYRLIYGNLKARIRMTVLYAINEEYGDSLVIGTGNFSEIFMGYFTKWGDGACDFNPLGDFTKTEVRKIAKILEIPQEIIDAVPSADLWEGQSDEEEMGISYDEIDKCIYEGSEDEELKQTLIYKSKKAQHKLIDPPIFVRTVLACPTHHIDRLTNGSQEKV